MLLWIFVCIAFLGAAAQRPSKRVCLTGLATDVQGWVDEHGSLTSHIDSNTTLDLSSTLNPVTLIHKVVQSAQNELPIKYVSLARCRLNRIPAALFLVEPQEGQYLSQTVEYLTLYGNNFLEVSEAGKQYDVTLKATGLREVGGGIVDRGQIRAMWSASLQRVQFEKLRELDLRSCGIGALNFQVFENMPTLEALYLGQNVIHTITENAFVGLQNLLHLDLSNNLVVDANDNPSSISFENNRIFKPLQSLRSLDFSHTKIDPQVQTAFQSFGENLERVSFCYSGISSLNYNFFKRTPIKVLDISGNHGILFRMNALSGLEKTLKVLYANEVGLTSFDIFENFNHLEILSIVANEIGNIRPIVARTLSKLQILNLSTNRVVAWFTPVFINMPTLRFLDLRYNMINIIVDEMMIDFSNISYVAMTHNPIVCNCQARDFMEIAARNEILLPKTTIKPFNGPLNGRFNFHTGYLDANSVIKNRINVSKYCNYEDGCFDSAVDSEGAYLLLDYDLDTYVCLEVGNGGTKTAFTDMKTCVKSGVKGFDEDLERGRTQLLLLLVLPGVILPCLLLAFIFRRSLRFCYVTMRNSAMLSMVNKNKVITEDTIYNYDVFVSYCNEDRKWVLDSLLTHLEKDCSVSLCLHERDFQVGLSILENIVSCMDRSKAIMLVISQQFLLSQWCQFELHLAQHRLLETRREDLILVLLEDIPRRLRPNTLHYLMLTKTYIIWPKKKCEEHLFWKRLKKTVVPQRQPDSVTLA